MSESRLAKRIVAFLLILGGAAALGLANIAIIKGFGVLILAIGLALIVFSRD